MVQKILLWAAALALLSATACNKASTGSAALVAGFALGQAVTAVNIPSTAGTGQVQFSFSQAASSVQSLANSGDVSVQSWAQGEYPANPIISVNDSSGANVMDQQTLSIRCQAGTPGFSMCYSSPIPLPPGTYSITQFSVFVIDSQGGKAYATPVAGSQVAHLVKHPLPVSFIVTKDQVSQPELEVIAVAGNPADFGFSSFSFDKVDTFTFDLAVDFTYNDGVQTLIPATVIVQGYMGNNHGPIVYNTEFHDDVPAATTRIRLLSSYDYHRIVVKYGDYCTVSPGFSQSILSQYSSIPFVDELSTQSLPSCPWIE